MRHQTAARKAPGKLFSHGAPSAARQRPTGIPPSLFYLSFGLLSVSNVLTLVAFLMAPDISALLNGENDRVVAAYEDRIAELRVEVDRLHSRSYAQAGDINLQLQELSQQQEVLLEQHQYVRQLAAKASELGIDTAITAAPLPASRPVAVNSATASAEPAAELAAAGALLDDMMTESRVALAAISEAATASTDTIISELAGIGIRPLLPELGDALGGPYQPAHAGADAVSLVDDANAVFEALARFRAARGAIDLAPVHRPIAGTSRLSSGFGNRRDPFTKGKAFHAGIDFPAASGTPVLSAGEGRVSFVGKKSGYGNVVEISHGEGLLTRYAHLSAFLVKEGQTVQTGTPIARVGSTGRSTGPHLHFEVRSGEQAIDPGRFLAVGRRLAPYLDA